MNGVLLILLLEMTAAAQSDTHCYEIRVDDKDRSFYQYVDSTWVRFADPVWKQNPQLKEIRLVSAEGKPLTAPMVIGANPNPQQPWGGIQFRHLQPGTTLSLKAAQNSVSFRRRDSSAPDCPQMNLVLDGRWNGYDVLQHVPSGTRKPLLGSYVQPSNGKVLLKIALPNVLEAKAVLMPAKVPNTERPFSLEKLSASELLKRQPDLQTQVTKQWGMNASYLIFQPIEPKDTIKITVKLASGRDASFFVRKLPES